MRIICGNGVAVQKIALGSVRGFQAEMPVSARGHNASARRALQEPLLHQKRFDDIFDGVAFFRQGGGDGLDADGTAAVIFDDVAQVTPVHGIEAARIDFEARQRAIGDRRIDRQIILDDGEVAHPA